MKLSIACIRDILIFLENKLVQNQNGGFPKILARDVAQELIKEYPSQGEVIVTINIMLKES